MLKSCEFQVDFDFVRLVVGGAVAREQTSPLLSRMLCLLALAYGLEEESHFLVRELCFALDKEAFEGRGTTSLFVSPVFIFLISLKCNLQYRFMTKKRKHTCCSSFTRWLQFASETKTWWCVNHLFFLPFFPFNCKLEDYSIQSGKLKIPFSFLCNTKFRNK